MKKFMVGEDGSGGGANTVGGAMPLPWDLPLVGPLAEPVGVTPDECLEEPLGGQGSEVASRGGNYLYL